MILAFGFAFRAENIRHAAPMSDFEACVHLALFFATIGVFIVVAYYVSHWNDKP